MIVGKRKIPQQNRNPQKEKEMTFEEWIKGLNEAYRETTLRALGIGEQSLMEEAWQAATERAEGIADDEFQHLINGKGLVVPRVAVKAHLETFKERICGSE